MGNRKPHPWAGSALRRRGGGHSGGSGASSVPPGALQESKAATKGGGGTAGCPGQHSPRAPGSRRARGPCRKPGPLRPAGLCDSPRRRRKRNGTSPWGEKTVGNRLITPKGRGRRIPTALAPQGYRGLPTRRGGSGRPIPGPVSLPASPGPRGPRARLTCAQRSPPGRRSFNGYRPPIGRAACLSLFSARLLVVRVRRFPRPAPPRQAGRNPHRSSAGGAAPRAAAGQPLAAAAACLPQACR